MWSISSTSASAPGASTRSTWRIRPSASRSSSSSARRSSPCCHAAGSGRRMVDPSSAPGVRVLRVPEGSDGRVDRYVADATGLSRSYVQKLISDGRLTADGAALRANTLVGAGTELRLDVPPPVALEMLPAPEIALTVVYEDDDM